MSLPGILQDGLMAPAAVGHPAGIPEIDDVLAGSCLRSSRTPVRPPRPLSNTPMGRLSMVRHRPFPLQEQQGGR